MSEKQPTLGESRVRISFNPAENALVAQIKRKTAELIDLCDKVQGAQDDFINPRAVEGVRLWKLAMTAYEEAGMWAVKAATIGY